MSFIERIIVLVAISFSLTTWSDEMKESKIRYSIITYGASVANEPSANRKAIQAAIDAASAYGGGCVVIPSGEWLSGSIELKSGVELHLAGGAILKGSVRQDDYNADDVFPENFYYPGEEWSGGHLIYARLAHDIAITGEGTIDGNGGAFFEEEEQFIWGFPGYKYGIKLFPTDRNWFRPGPLIAIFMSAGIRIEGVTLSNTPCWTCHIRCSEDVSIRDVTIDADRTIANSDGFSIDCSRRVMIDSCDIRTGDDGFAIRASCDHHAQTNHCENIIVRNCDVRSCCFGVRLGIGTGTIRHVAFEDCRFHESAWGVGFTPAWVEAGRNVHIEDVRFSRCTIRECERGVVAWMPNADALVKGVLFEDCGIESLLPCSFLATDQAPIEDVRFVRCHRAFIKRLKVRQDYCWLAGHLAEMRRDADLIYSGNAQISCIESTPMRDEPKGVLMLWFDDRHFGDWLAARDLFLKYGAHATFCVSGEIDNEAIRAMKVLLGDGHSLALHGLHHADADIEAAARGADGYYDFDVAVQKRTCEVSYLPTTTFAYPNCRRTAETDKLFFSHGFERVRGCVESATVYDPDGTLPRPILPPAENDEVFFPAKELPQYRLIRTLLLGEAYQTDLDEILACLDRAAARREVIALTSHGIDDDAKGIHLKREWLEAILEHASSLGLRILGADDLPPPAGL